MFRKAWEEALKLAEIWLSLQSGFLFCMNEQGDNKAEFILPWFIPIISIIIQVIREKPISSFRFQLPH